MRYLVVYGGSHCYERSGRHVSPALHYEVYKSWTGPHTDETSVVIDGERWERVPSRCAHPDGTPYTPEEWEATHEEAKRVLRSVGVDCSKWLGEAVIVDHPAVRRLLAARAMLQEAEDALLSIRGQREVELFVVGTGKEGAK